MLYTIISITINSPVRPGEVEREEAPAHPVPFPSQLCVHSEFLRSLYYVVCHCHLHYIRVFTGSHTGATNQSKEDK